MAARSGCFLLSSSRRASLLQQPYRPQQLRLQRQASHAGFRAVGGGVGGALSSGAVLRSPAQAAAYSSSLPRPSALLMHVGRRRPRQEQVLCCARGRQPQQQGRSLHSSAPAWSTGVPPVGHTGSTAVKVFQMPGGERLKIALLSSMIAFTAGLGAWQTSRYYWKVDLMEEKKDLLHADPIVLPDGATYSGLTSLGEDVTGRKVLVKGVFDHEKEVLIGLRGPPVDTLAGDRKPIYQGTTGYLVYTPLKLSDGRGSVIVNRGWIERTAEAWSRPTEQVALTGVIAREEKTGSFAPVNVPASKKLAWLQMSALAEAMGIPSEEALPVVLDAVVSDNTPLEAKGVPIAKRERHICNFWATPTTHMTYAATWFALSVCGLAILYSRYGGRRSQAVAAQASSALKRQGGGEAKKSAVREQRGAASAATSAASETSKNIPFKTK